ncbi:hypothetical protein SAMN03159300_11822 [Janthinobacterium sp. 344]|nr:hypothetical protein SAMN03159349_05508 [Janthinobacterium sp. 551a]SFB65939.1 hypothetical protein SAMN03159300_11822 [Janthinobacterium sp. 344]
MYRKLSLDNRPEHNDLQDFSQTGNPVENTFTILSLATVNERFRPGAAVHIWCIHST